MIADEEEHQFRWSHYEDEGKPIIQTNAAFEDSFRQTTNAYACMNMRVAPRFLHGVHGLANRLPFLFGTLAKLRDQILGDSNP